MKKKKRVTSPGVPQNSVEELLKSDEITAFLEALAADKTIRGIIVITVSFDGQLRLGRREINSFEAIGVLNAAYQKMLDSI